MLDEEAQNAVDEARKEGYNEGYEKGHNEGYEKGEEDNQGRIVELGQDLDDLQNRITDVYNSY
ncbi:hypothetical protein LCGC14_0330110 [marine sediment metagenome]|uniref:Essential protein Yae1 N-terminal domain-containing protein n=1 Tax=marine sediment metagenome TaxID=412755 RepID=A0A0F9WP03_9ZZZZ